MSNPCRLYGCAALLVAMAQPAAVQATEPDPDVQVVSSAIVRCSDGSCLSIDVRREIRGTRWKRLVEVTSVRLDSEGVGSLSADFGAATQAVASAILTSVGRSIRARSKHRKAAARRALDQLESSGHVDYLELLPTVEIRAPIRERLERIASRYFRATGRRVVVTSGTRGPHGQAAAMFGKLARGSNLVRLYRNRRAARAIQNAYRSGRRLKRSRAEIVGAMAGVITNQVDQGVYISKHLLSGAVDVRSRNLSRADRRALRQAVAAERGVRVLEEHKPPHFHLSFR